MQAHSRPVKPQDLGIIGEEHFRRRFEAAGCDMETFDYRKDLDDDSDGLPVVAEFAFACRDGFDEDNPARRRLITGVNWSPGIVNPFRQLGPYGESLDLILTEQRAAVRRAGYRGAACSAAARPIPRPGQISSGDGMKADKIIKLVLGEAPRNGRVSGKQKSVMLLLSCAAVKRWCAHAR